MKNTTKYIAIILIVILTTIFAAACTNVTVDALITEDNLVTYTYDIMVTDIDEDDINYDGIQLFFLDIKKYWEEEGLDCELLIGDGGIHLTGTLSKQCSTREEAFNTLYEYMTHKTSVFDDVTLNYTEDFYKASYSLVSHLDLRGIINEDIYSVYPEIVGDDVNEFIKGFKATVKVSLPTDADASSGVENIIQNELVTDVTLDKLVEISLSGTITNTQNAASEAVLKKSESVSRISILISGSVALLSIVSLIVLIVYNRKNKLHEEDIPKQKADSEEQKSEE